MKITSNFRYGSSTATSFDVNLLLFVYNVIVIPLFVRMYVEIIHELQNTELIIYQLYTTYISADFAHYETFHAKVPMMEVQFWSFKGYFLGKRGKIFINPFKPTYKLDQTILILRVDGRYFCFYSNFNRTSYKQTVEILIRRSGTVCICLHCLHMSYKKSARLI